jgi:hypothetical protein
VRVLRYRVSNKDAQLVYQGTWTPPQQGSKSRAQGELLAAPQPVIYTDSDLAEADNAESRAGYLAKVANGVVTWASKKLPQVALSSAEAEYKALGEGVKDAIWLKQLYTELGLDSSPTTMVYCDNTASIQISKNPVQHNKTRHFKLAWHFVRQVQKAGEILVEFVSTKLQDADVLTKALTVGPFKSAVERLGLFLDGY